MKRAVVVGVLVMIMTMGLVASKVEAVEHGPAVSGSYASSNAALKTVSPMMTTNLAEWYAWLIYQLKKYTGIAYPYPNPWNHHPKGSVPIPGTLIPAVGGFGALVAWWERRRRL